MANAIENVEKETDKVLHKFNEIQNHSKNTLGDLIQQIESYQRDLSILTGNLIFCFKIIFIFLLTFH